MGLFDLPNAHDKSDTIGGRRDRKYVPIPQEYSLTGPLSADEGVTETYTFTTNQPDGTYYFANIPTGEVANDNGSFTVSGGTGTFTLTPNEDSVVGDNVYLAATVRSGSVTGPILAVTSVTIVDDTFVATYSASGPTSIDEGDTGTFNFYTNVTDGTYNFSVLPTGRYNVDSGTFTVASEYGSFTLTGLTNTTTADTEQTVITIKDSGNTVRSQLSCDITDSTIPEVSAGDTEIFTFGDTWKYEDSATDLGTSWTGTSYDDSSWSSGAGELGFGDGDETTTIADNNQITTYFRKTVTINNATGYDSFEIDVLYDDSYMVWINGVESSKERLSTGATYSTLASSGTGENNRKTDSLPVSAFINGDNVIAVEVHQINATSSDKSFDMELVARKNVAGQVTYSFQDGDSNGYAGTTDTYVQSGSNESTNRGTNNVIYVDKNSTNQRFSMLRFDDISDAYETPEDIVVSSAELQLTINSEGQGSTFHNMLGAWTESTTYSTIGTLATGGTGYTLSATGTDPGANNYIGDVTITLDAATVQDWIRAQTSYGLFGIATHSSDGTQYRSSDWTNQTQRPKLTVVSTGTPLA